MKHYLIFAILICTALLCYSAGSVTGAVALTVLGVLLEIVLWLGIFKSNKRT